MISGIGIDFGTTNSVAATYNIGNKICSPLTNKSTKLPHPSVIWYRADGSVVVGAEAKTNILGFSNVPGHQFVSSVKRKLGHLSNLRIFGENKPIDEVTSHFFRHLKANAKLEWNREIIETVLTVPIYFNGMARRELRKAADLAGIYIKTFIHEPFAAIVGYCHEASKGLRFESLKDRLFLVFDWGGGTLDITVVSINNGSIVQLSTSGMSDCAGDLFDEKLSKHVIRKFSERLGVSVLDVNPAPGNMDRLRIESERNKIRLSDVERSQLQVAGFWNFSGQMQSINELVTREKFEDLIKIEVQDAIGQVRKALDNAGVTEDDIDRVLMIGGSSKVPVIKEMLQEKFGSRLEYVANADTIIAEGAAIIDAYNLQPSLAHSLCVEMSDGTPFKIFQSGEIANENILSKTLNFICTDNRDGEGRLIIGEKLDKEGKNVISKLILPVPVNPALPKPYNHERVTVKFSMDRDMVLHISAKAATQSTFVTQELYDICFGLSFQGASII